MEQDVLLKNACNAMGIIIEDEQIEQFFKFRTLLLQWNEKINLTAIKEEQDILLKHFIDSIAAINVVDFNEARVIDVGSGAGFPGIPLKIMNPSCMMTLLDSVQKKLKFTDHVIHELGLKDITALHLRAEDAGRHSLYREKYDICISRAVAGLDVLAELCLPFVKIGGQMIAYKGPSAEDEMRRALKSIEVLGGRIESAKKVEIPFTDLSHTIIIISKIKHTPPKYPRKAGQVKSNPIN